MQTPAPDATPAKAELANTDHLRFHRPHAPFASPFGNGWFALKAELFAPFFRTPVFL